MNEIALYEGYIVKLNEYSNSGEIIFLSNDGTKTKQIINAMIFRTFEKATECKVSDYEIIPFCCEFKY